MNTILITVEDLSVTAEPADFRKVIGDPKQFASVKDGSRIRVSGK